MFPNNVAIFQDGNLPIHAARSVHSCFEEREYALQHHLWLAQSPDLNIIKPLVSLREQGEKLIPSRLFRQMVAQLHIDKEMCIFHSCIDYFCPFPVHAAKLNSLG
jgi:hypothetical protein